MDAISITINIKLSYMNLETFLTNLFLYGSIVIGLLIVFWNNMADFFFETIEPHESKKMWLKSQKVSNKIAKVTNHKKLSEARTALLEFRKEYEHDQDAKYFIYKLQQMIDDAERGLLRAV